MLTSVAECFCWLYSKSARVKPDLAHMQRSVPLIRLLDSQVSYEAGSRGQRLGPLYMNALDNELIQTLHRAATDLQPEQPIIVELVFHILDE